MIDFDLHIRDPQQQTYNTAFVYNRVLTKTLSLEIVVINMQKHLQKKVQL